MAAKKLDLAMLGVGLVVVVVTAYFSLQQPQEAAIPAQPNSTATAALESSPGAR